MNHFSRLAQGESKVKLQFELQLIICTLVGNSNEIINDNSLFNENTAKLSFSILHDEEQHFLMKT